MRVRVKACCSDKIIAKWYSQEKPACPPYNVLVWVMLAKS